MALRQQIYDDETGNVIRDEKFERKAKSKHFHYYLTFYSTLAKAGKSLTAPALIIFGQMDGKNRINLDLAKLNIIHQNYEIPMNTIKTTISRMCRNGLMQRLGNASYFANPYYFTKANINKLEELRTEYSEMLFETKKKIKITETQRIAGLEKQIQDIIRK